MLKGFNQISFRWTDLAVVGVVAASVISGWIGNPDLPLTTGLLVVGLSVVYSVITTLVFNTIVVSGYTRLAWLYYPVQFGLVTAIIYLSRGGAALLIVPLAAQSAWISAYYMAAVSATLLSMIVAVYYLLYQNWGVAIQSFFSLGSALVFVFIFSQVLLQMEKSKTEVERLATELGAANRKLREYSVQVEELATTKERNRLAREIHDSLGHYFTVINVQIEAARTIFRSDPEHSWEALSKAQALTKDGLGEVRRSIAALRILPTENRSLPEAITSLVEDSRSAGIITEFTVTGPVRPLEPQVELTLYRAAQEGLTNIRKHAFASRAELCLNYDDPAQVRLRIADNGAGLKSADTGGFGLLGMRERVQLLNGRLETSSVVGRGFTLEVEIPL